MAVYTHVSDDELASFLKLYDIGKATSLKGISAGVENTNYFLYTDQNQYILTLFEKRVNINDLPFYLSLMDHMAQKGLPAAQPVAARDGSVLQQLCSRAAAIIKFVPGVSQVNPNPKHCDAMGTMLANAHNAVLDFDERRTNDLSLAGWQNLAAGCMENADHCEEGLSKFIREELQFLNENWPIFKTSPIPSGVIHSDFFPDNVLFDKEDNISGIIDFYFSCTDFFIYDIAICINAWCFNHDHVFDQQRAKALLLAYHKVRPLSELEHKTLPLMLRGSAIRFLLTRLFDWLNRVDGAVVKIKDPLEYQRKLLFHKNNPNTVLF